jgi:hypothetical protein
MGNLSGHEPTHLDVYVYVTRRDDAAAVGDLRPLHVACLKAAVRKIQVVSCMHT